MGELEARMLSKWKILNKELLIDARIFKVFSQHSTHPLTKKEHRFSVIESRNWVNVIALTKENKVLLIRQYRAGIDDISLEIPGGVVDETDVDPVATGVRELAEETGYTGEQAKLIGWVNPNPAIQGNTCYFVLVKNCKKTQNTNFDACEEIETELADLKDIPELIRTQKISHALVHCAFQYLFLNHPLSLEGRGPGRG